MYWGNISFFALSFMLVVVFPQMWFIAKMGLFAQMMLNIITWGSMLVKKPFTIDYAKQYIPQEYWNNPAFLRKNYIITGVWGCYFLLGLISAEIRLYEPGISHGAVFFTSLYSKHKKSPR